MKRPLSLVICFAVPFVILLTGIIFSALFAVQNLPEAFRDDHRGLIPAGFSIRLEKPLRYNVWGYLDGTLDDQRFLCSQELLERADVHVHDGRTGEKLDLKTWWNSSKETLREKAILLGTFETVYAGQEVRVLATNLENDVVVGISSKGFSDIFRAILAMVGIFLISVFLAIAALVVLLHRRQKQIRAMEAE